MLPGTFSRYLSGCQWTVALLLAAVFASCAPDPHNEKSAPLEIIGTYIDEYSTTQIVTATEWSDSYGDVFHIRSYSNEQDFLLAQNDPANPYNGGLYSRFDWTTFNSDLYYCQSVYDAPDIATAEAGSADRTNPPASGCGGFNWTNLTPPPGP
jgi:hypothetical protein